MNKCENIKELLIRPKYDECTDTYKMELLTQTPDYNYIEPVTVFQNEKLNDEWIEINIDCRGYKHLGLFGIKYKDSLTEIEILSCHELEDEIKYNHYFDSNSKKHFSRPIDISICQFVVLRVRGKGLLKELKISKSW